MVIGGPKATGQYNPASPQPSPYAGAGGHSSPMGARNLPYQPSQPSMGQNQGGAQGGRANDLGGGIWGSSSNARRMRPPGGPATSIFGGAWGQNFGNNNFQGGPGGGKQFGGVPGGGFAPPGMPGGWYSGGGYNEGFDGGNIGPNMPGRGGYGPAVMPRWGNGHMPGQLLPGQTPYDNFPEFTGGPDQGSRRGRQVGTGTGSRSVTSTDWARRNPPNFGSTGRPNRGSFDRSLLPPGAMA